MQKRKIDFMILRDAQSANEIFQGAHPKRYVYKKSKARPNSSCDRHTIGSRHQAPPCGFSEKEALYRYSTCCAISRADHACLCESYIHENKTHGQVIFLTPTLPTPHFTEVKLQTLRRFFCFIYGAIHSPL